MSKGTVKFFNDSKGFGFITEEGSNNEHFVDQVQNLRDFRITQKLW
jgi:cold shock CspA family protein